MCILQNRIGLWRCLPAAALCRRQLRQNPLPNIEITGDLLAGGIARRKLRYLHQPALNRVYKPEIANDPWEGLIGLRGYAAKVVRCSRQVDAKVHATHPVDLVETIYPDGRLVKELFGLLLLAELLRLLLFGRWARNAVRMVRLVVEDENIALASEPFEHALDQGRVALDVARYLHLRLNELPAPPALLCQHPDKSRRRLSLQRFHGKHTRAAARCVLHTDRDRLDGGQRHTAAVNAAVFPIYAWRLRLEDVPVRQDDIALTECGH